MRFGIVVALLAMVGTGVTCREERACRLVGCSNTVTFDVHDLPQRERLHAEGCIEDRCADLRGVLAMPQVPPRCLTSERGDDLQLVVCEDEAGVGPVRLVLEDGDLEGSHVVSLSISTDAQVLVDITREVPFQPLQPNGPGCDPVCWVAVVRDDGS